MKEVLSKLLIIGGGPAGLSAAIYACRAGLDTVLLEIQAARGGQMATTPSIENYPGLLQTDGFALGESMEQQALALGADLRTATVTALHLEAGALRAETADTVYRAQSVILAMGARRKTLDVPGESALSGRGVSYCAVCDGFFFKGKTLAVIGGGETALEDALYLAELGSPVTLIHRRNAFRGSRRTLEKVRAHKNITILTPYVTTEILGDKAVEALRLRHAETGAEHRLGLNGVFVCVGTAANSELIGAALPTDGAGRLIAGEDCATALPGVFVAGDLRQKPLYQIVTAAADGAVAATRAAQFIEVSQALQN